MEKYQGDEKDPAKMPQQEQNPTRAGSASSSGSYNQPQNVPGKTPDKEIDTKEREDDSEEKKSGNTWVNKTPKSDDDTSSKR